MLSRLVLLQTSSAQERVLSGVIVNSWKLEQPVCRSTTHKARPAGSASLHQLCAHSPGGAKLRAAPSGDTAQQPPAAVWQCWHKACLC